MAFRRLSWTQIPIFWLDWVPDVGRESYRARRSALVRPVVRPVFPTAFRTAFRGEAAAAGPFLVGFAASVGGVAGAEAKRKEKGCDVILANDVSVRGLGFDSANNALTLFRRGRRRRHSRPRQAGLSRDGDVSPGAVDAARLNGGDLTAFHVRSTGAHGGLSYFRSPDCVATQVAALWTRLGFFAPSL